jgi:short-subunit dehydrogenase
MNEQLLCTIIGMGRGISLAVARRFATEGFRIGMVSRDADELRTLASEFPESRHAVADAGVQAELRQALRFLGPANVLVYNASAGHPGVPTMLSRADLVADFEVNIVGLLAAVQETAAAMRAAGKGTIIITGGGLALAPAAPLASLSFGKAAQRNLAFSLACELEPAGIHVATVTICGFVQPGTHFAAEKIASEYWRLHCQQPGEFDREVVYR